MPRLGLCVCCVLVVWCVFKCLVVERSLGIKEKHTLTTTKTMPMDVSLTIAEREAELAALQNAFDEYISSSRELEEELDAELGKMRKSRVAPPPSCATFRSLCIASLNFIFLHTAIFTIPNRGFLWSRRKAERIECCQCRSIGAVGEYCSPAHSSGKGSC